MKKASFSFVLYTRKAPFTGQQFQYDSFTNPCGTLARRPFSAYSGPVYVDQPPVADRVLFGYYAELYVGKDLLARENAKIVAPSQ